jgi:hypothetical protein
MRGMKWAIGAVAVLFAALNLGWAADDETYDLRGPAPKVKQVFTSKGSMKIKDADTTVKVGGQTVNLKMSILATSEEEATVMAVDGRNVTKCRTKIVKERADITVNIGGEDMTQTEPAALEKEIIISERDGKKWKHALVDTDPSDKQKKELDNRNGLENDDELYPADKVKIGHTWTVDAAALAKMMGNSFSDLKGKVNQKFTKVEDVNGEKCAVIDSNAKVTCKMKEDGEPTMDAEFELKITTWKSLKTGVNVKEKFEGKMKMSGTVNMDGAKVEMTLAGPISGESTSKMTEKK